MSLHNNTLQPPVRVVCLSHDVLVLQPCTGTDPYLGSVANDIFYAILTAPPVSTVFLYNFIPPPLFYTPPPTPTSIVLHCIAPIFHPPPTSYPSVKFHPPGRHPHLLPTRLDRLTLRPAPCACICRRFLHLFDPPLPPSYCDQFPIRPWGLSHRGSIHIHCVSTSPTFVFFRLLTYSGSCFLVG